MEERIAARIREELFKTKEQRDQATNDLMAVQTTPGWSIIKRILDVHVEEWEKEILNNDEITIEKAKELKHDRFHFLYVKNLPSDTVESFRAEENIPEQKLDPYEGGTV